MKRIFKILGILAVSFFIYVIIVLGIQFFYILNTSPVNRINPKLNTNSAIMVIDVQNMLTFYDDPHKAAEYGVAPFLKSINQAISKNPGYEVIYIRQEFTRNSLLSFLLPTFPEQGDEGTEINGNIYKANSKIFTKSQADAFSNPALQQYLNSKKIGTLYITGLAAEACVNSTVKGATANGYRVYVVREAVLSMTGGVPDRKRLDKYRSYGAEIISLNDLK